MNKVFLKGRLGKDPEAKTFGEKTVCTATFATSEYKDKTNWHTLKTWGKSGELMANTCKKGTELVVEGRIDYGSYEKDGVTRYTTDIVVDRFEYCGSKIANNPDQQDIPF